MESNTECSHEFNYGSSDTWCDCVPLGQYCSIVSTDSDAFSGYATYPLSGSATTACVSNAQKEIYAERQGGTGVCEDMAEFGYDPITTKAQCEKAAAALNWDDTTASLVDTSNKASGCFQSSNGALTYFNTFDHLSKYAGGTNFACSITCQPGTYQDDTGQTRCKDCTIGRSQDQSGMSYCKMCSPEQMSEDEFHKMFYDDYFSDGEVDSTEFKRITIKLGEPLSDEEVQKIIEDGVLLRRGDNPTNSYNGVTYDAFMRWWRRSCHNKPSINNDDQTTKNQQVGSVPTTPSSNDNNQIEEEQIDNTALFIVFIVIGIIVIVAGLFWIKMLRKKRSRGEWKRK